MYRSKFRKVCLFLAVSIVLNLWFAGLQFASTAQLKSAEARCKELEASHKNALLEKQHIQQEYLNEIDRQIKENEIQEEELEENLLNSLEFREEDIYADYQSNG